MKKLLLCTLLGLSVFIPSVFAQTDVAVDKKIEAVQNAVDTSAVKAPADIADVKADADKSVDAKSAKENLVVVRKKEYKKLTSKIIEKMIFSLLGGLGIFLLGMRYMSDGIQKIAGASLKKLIKMVTNNRFLACTVGVMLTMLVQSSSVTTVMAVGFVNSGIMALNQAIGVILGANIGTTVTGWVIALKIGKWGLPILGISAFVYLFSKKERVKYFALALLGLGMIFAGLELMKAGFKPMADIKEFEEAFAYFNADDYFGVLKCAFVGCVLTVIVQSSSATLGITIALASTGVITFEAAAALVLGENICTTITAFLASLGDSTNAKRAAYFHKVFNLIGVFWITLLFRPYIEMVTWVIGSFRGVADLNAMGLVEVNGEMVMGFPHMTLGIATVHTIFNVANVLFFLPFTGFFAAKLEKLVKDKKVIPDKTLTNLDFQMYDSPFAAIAQSSHELKKMDKKTFGMYEELKSYIKGEGKEKNVSRNIFRGEELLDKVQTEITDFLTDVMSQPLSHDEIEEAKKQLLLADEYESVSDYIMSILKHFKRIEEANMDFSPTQREEILQLHQLIESFYSNIHRKDKNIQMVHTDAIVESDEITGVIRKMRSKHWERLSEKRIEPLLSTTFTDVLNGYRKIKTILMHVAETKAGIK